MNRKDFIIGITVFFMTFGVTTAAEVVRITNGEWPPFTSEKLPHQGPLSRIVAAAFALEGVTVEYGFFPWKRAYDYAKTGKWDASVGWAPSAEHLQDFYMSTPVILVDKALFHLKSTPFDWKTIDDLSQWRVGGTSGYSYGVEWDQALKFGRLKVEEVNLDEQNIRKLLLKRIDVAAMEVEVANHLIETLLTPAEAALITHHPRLIMQTSICVAFSRQEERSPALLARFNRGLHRLKDSGRYDEYLAQARQSSRPNVRSDRDQ
jgi:polar amino acid transport system substrate-binding protein